MIDVYPVGLLREIKMLWRASVTRRSALPDVARKHAWRNLRNCFRIHIWRNIRNRRWHELKNTFNGYLAEPTPFPEGLRRCGSGWTKRRALRSLERHGAART